MNLSCPTKCPILKTYISEKVLLSIIRYELGPYKAIILPCLFSCGAPIPVHRWQNGHKVVSVVKQKVSAQHADLLVQRFQLWQRLQASKYALLGKLEAKRAPQGNKQGNIIPLQGPNYYPCINIDTFLFNNWCFLLEI